jgi:hypothetical protein
VPEADYFWFGGGAPRKSALGCGRRAGANRLDEKFLFLYFFITKQGNLT